MRLIDRARTQGEKLLNGLETALSGHENVGDIRGIGLLLCIDLVENIDSKKPFSRGDRTTERVLERAREIGLLLYPSTGNVDGTDGDYILLGPPLTVLDDEIDLIIDRTTTALRGI